MLMLLRFFNYLLDVMWFKAIGLCTDELIKHTLSVL